VVEINANKTNKGKLI